MKEFPAMDSVVWPPPGMGCIKSVENNSESLLIDCLGPLHILKIYHSSTIKECQYHYLGSCQSFPGLLRMRLILPQPLPGLCFHVRVIDPHPGLVHGDDRMEHSWVLVHEPGHEVAHIPAVLLVGISQDSWHEDGALFGQLQVFFEDPLDAGGG